MGNTNENLKAAQDYYANMQRQIDRSHKTGGVLAGILLGGMVLAVVLAIVALCVVVF